MIAITRRYRLAAAHVLRSRVLSDAENERVFGKCANAPRGSQQLGMGGTRSCVVSARSRISCQSHN